MANGIRRTKDAISLRSYLGSLSRYGLVSLTLHPRSEPSEARWPLSFSSGVYRVVHRQALHFPGTLLLAWRLSPKSRKERGMLDLP